MTVPPLDLDSVSRGTQTWYLGARPPTCLPVGTYLPEYAVRQRRITITNSIFEHDNINTATNNQFFV